MCMWLGPVYLRLLLALQRQRANKRHTDKILFSASQPKLKIYKTGTKGPSFNLHTHDRVGD